MKDNRHGSLTASWLWLAVLIEAGPLLVNAQTTRGKSEPDLLGDFDKNVSTPQAITQPKGLALESTIDPTMYFVGPSDVFSVNIWVSPPLNLMLTVTPEGTLIIPTVGEIKVADVTLAEAKRLIVDEIKKKYIRGQVTATLFTPRPVVVTVTGNVLNQGSYVLASYNRVDKAIEQANKVLLTEAPWQLDRVLGTMSTRNIRVKHKDGTICHVDIMKYLATKEDRWDPYLREGDVIVVPRNDFKKNVIGVYGEVNAPGRYEYVQGDSVVDALRIAYGFTPAALSDSIDFSRLDLDGRTQTERVLDGKSLLAGRATDFALEPGDRVVVRSKPDLRADYIASIEGEVNYPGTYPITKDRTKISEIIRKAGGFTQFAAINSAELQRRSVQPAEIELERLQSLRGGVAPEDTSYFYLETELRIRKEVVNVDFKKLIVDGDSTQDVVLQTDDRIVVPSLKRTVYVFGQVVSPGAIPFFPGEDVRYYIGKAGGFTDRARSGDLKVVKAKTRQWLSPDETTIEEGDYVWVPKEIERSFAYYMGVFGQFASVLSVGVSITLLVIQVTKK